MCGILIHRKQFKPSFGIEHRGIESGDFDFNGYKFHHRSLPLQTLSDNKEDYIQPKHFGDYFILFNGEIFNFRKFGIHKSDLDYLCKFFANGFTRSLLTEMNLWDGFWSIVLVHKPSKRAIIFTDPLGKKQLYVNTNGVCSEIRPLLDKKHLDSKMEYDESKFGTLNTPYFYVQRLMPGNIYEWDLDNKHGYTPGKIINNYFPLRVPSIKSDLKGMMNESIKNRLINKMDGVTLLFSGGLDSTIILYHLLDRGAKPEVLTIENQTDDKYVKIAEKFFKFKAKRIKLNPKLLREAVAVFEHPVDYGSLLPQYCLCKAASNRVIFTGDGADELFGGYKRSQISDTQMYDVFTELPYYHHIRLDRVSMAFTKEIRSPFLSTDIIKYALSLPYYYSGLYKGKGVYEPRFNKNILKDTYKDVLPEEIILREKEALRMNGKKDNGVKKIFYGNK